MLGLAIWGLAILGLAIFTLRVYGKRTSGVMAKEGEWAFDTAEPAERGRFRRALAPTTNAFSNCTYLDQATKGKVTSLATSTFATPGREVPSTWNRTITDDARFALGSTTETAPLPHRRRRGRDGRQGRAVRTPTAVPDHRAHRRPALAQAARELAVRTR